MALRDLYTLLEFKTWLNQLRDSDIATPGLDADVPKSAAIATEYETVLTQARFDHWLDQLKKAELFAFDTETTSLDYMQAQIVGVSFAVEAGKAAYVPLAHDYLGAPAQLDREQVLNVLKPLLEDANKAKLGQNLKYDMSVLANHGITMAGIRFDTMLESYVLNSTASRHDMDTLALAHLGHPWLRRR